MSHLPACALRGLSSQSKSITDSTQALCKNKETNYLQRQKTTSCYRCGFVVSGQKLSYLSADNTRRIGHTVHINIQGIFHQVLVLGFS
jgi:hypothetical protein